MPDGFRDTYRLRDPDAPHAAQLPADAEFAVRAADEAIEELDGATDNVSDLRGMLSRFDDLAEWHALPADAQRRAEMVRDGMAAINKQMEQLLRIMRGEVQ